MVAAEKLTPMKNNCGSIIVTSERSGPDVRQLRKLAKLYQLEGRGALQVKENDLSALICAGDLILFYVESKTEARAMLRAGGFCQVDKNFWRPRYDGAPWMAQKGGAL